MKCYYLEVLLILNVNKYSKIEYIERQQRPVVLAVKRSYYFIKQSEKGFMVLKEKGANVRER